MHMGRDAGVPGVDLWVGLVSGAFVFVPLAERGVCGCRMKGVNG
jgi:hypothetical protein